MENIAINGNEEEHGRLPIGEDLGITHRLYKVGGQITWSDYVVSHLHMLCLWCKS